MASTSGGPRKRRANFSCMEQPPLIKQLRGILSEYPDGGQILKELIQNADDAEASELKIMLESRRINRNLTTQSPEFSKFFQAPALCIYNDAEFTKEDWRGIQMIYSSVKEEDSLKVGRFGLGFKYVFHMTDYPCVISGDTMLLIDPQRPAHEVNAKLKISEIHEIEGMETSDLLRAIGGKYGLDKSVVDKGYFRGTMFWFPLREKASPISEDVYDVGKVETLFDSLTSESSSILIFLKSLVRLQLLKMSQAGHEEHVLRVQIQDEKEIQARRHSFFSCIKSATSKQDVSCVFTMTIKEETASETLKLTTWLVVNHYIVHTATNDFKRLIQSPKLGLSPCVGVAAKIEPLSAVEGHIFCFLPLPKEGTKLTGLPFHVNGFFALSQNRHHLKWATDDQDHQYLNDEILWNEKLLTEALPFAFQQALDAAIEISVTNKNQLPLVNGVYTWIPNFETVLDTWKPFLKKALQLCEDKEIVFCEHFNSWKRVTDVVFTTFENLPKKLEFVKSTVRKAIGTCGKYPVVVPKHVFLTYSSLFGRKINDISPVMLSSILKLNPKYKYMADQEKKTLITYLTSDETIEQLEGIDLLLLASGKWDTFKHNGSSKYICSEAEIYMFPGSESQFIAPFERLDQCTKEVMRFICENKYFPFRDLEDGFLKTWLFQTLQSLLGPTLIMTERSHLPIDWLKLVWSSISHRGIRSFLDVPIFPVLLSGSFESKYQVKLVALQNSDLLLKHERTGNRYTCLDDDVEQSLRLLEITVITQLPNWLSCDLIKKFVVRPTIEDVKQLLQRKARSIDQQRIHSFNKDATMSNKSRLLDFLAQFGSIEGDLVYLLQKLRLFRSVKKLETCVTVDCDTHFVRESEHGNFPKNIEFPENCILVRRNGEIVAKQLNCTKLTLDKFMRIKLAVSKFDMSKTENKNVMMFFLKNIERFTTLIHSVSKMRFIKDTAGRLVKPSEIFDPFNEFLCRLFYGEHVFPAAKDALRTHRDSFIKLGMKGISTILPENIYFAAKTIDSVSQIDDNMYDKAKALQEYIEINPGVLRQTIWLDKTLGDEIQNLSCFVYCSPEECEWHDRLPQLLTWFSSKNRVCCPRDMKEIKFWPLVCSSMPLIKTRSVDLSSFYGWNIPPSADQILLNLKSIKQCSISTGMTLELLTMIKRIYEVLFVQSTPVVKKQIVSNALVLTADNFQDPDKVIVIQMKDDIELKPYVYFLHPELGSLQTFFKWLGCHSRQDENVLVRVLQLLKEKYMNRTCSAPEIKKDLKCAQMILERLAEADIDSSWASDNILMVVHSNSDQTIKFARLSECVYDDDPKCFNDVVDGESICYVHEQIPFDTVEKLGVKSVTGHSLADAQDFDHWGQRESFTTRLRSLLRDGYTDGLSVPKELLQNADDAGATEICFVYDERKHADSRERLLSKSLADFQGPALWCFNNKAFSEKDLQNIIKFNNSAKVDDLSTIGKFGLGFNAVYNITDIPSFISGADMVIFDPHEKYLVDRFSRKPTKGKRIPLSKRTLVNRHTDQFKPFQDMFGCNVLNEAFECFQGTLFRFPLRTAQQADISEICKTVYSHDEVICLFKMLLQSAEKLLLFCQNVSSIKLYHIPAQSSSANDMKMIYTAQKDSLRYNDGMCTYFEPGILSKAVSVYKHQHDRCIEEQHCITIRQTSCENDTFSRKFNCSKSNVDSTWLVTWVLNGRPKQLKVVDTIPLVAVATRCKTETDFTSQTLETTTVGDCDSGHMFCFLPLPISTGLPFHINGCFRVSDDRQRLVLLTEDDKQIGSKKASDSWNTFLMQEPLVKALFSAIQTTQRFCQTNEDAYRLWPRNCKPDVTPFVKSFYRAILDHNHAIFRDRGNCLSFDQILILKGDHGTSVFQIVLHFLVHVPVDKGKTVVEVPNSVCKYLQLYNNDRISIVQHAFISMVDALVHLLHNIGHSYWSDKLTIRNNLLAYAITVANKEMKICFRNIPCIPTAPNGRLRTVLDLIHPHSKCSKLFAESDERFIIQCESLNDPKIHATLVEIGMNSTSLPSELVFDRCSSLATLSMKCIVCTKNRLRLLLSYLSESQMPQETVDQIQHLNILPVLQRPSEWTFTWKAESLHTEIVGSGDVKCSKHADEKCTGIVLGRPDNLFRMNCRHCVGSAHYIVDETECLSTHLLNKLGVKTVEHITIFMLMEQLKTVGIEYESGKGMYTAETHNIIDKVYTELDNLTADLSKDEFNSLLDSYYSLAVELPIIEVGDVLVRVDIVAKCSIRSCPPHLYGLPKVSVSRWRILQKLGVKEYFSVTDVVGVLQLMTIENNRQIKLDIKDVIYILENLVECMHRENKTYADMQEFKECIIAPDREGRLFPTYQLALDDHDMTTKTSLRLLHEDITPNIGKLIGVKSKRHQLLRQYTHAIPFGQREELATRLNGILKDYPPDESIMKELIQNADDAGAREIHFIKYYEERKVDKTLKKGVELKPALCIYNDSCFTEQDFIGIQNLGIGSKAEDASKTGQFGLGFNAVYHITDTPSFLTKGKDLGENGQVCIFDPLFTQIEDIWGGEPGLRYNVDDLKDDFPDTTMGFPEIPGTCGTMFRFPLRTQPSKISISCLTPNEVNDMLKAFRRMMPDCLHFLKNIKKMKIRVYECGKYVDEYTVESEISNDTYMQRQTDFFKQVNAIVVSNVNRKEDNILVKPLNVTYTMRIHDTDGVEMTWLISHQFGTNWCDRSQLDLIYDIFRNEGLKLLPTGGVSLQLCSTNVRSVLQRLFKLSEQEKDPKMRSQTFQVPSVQEHAYRPCETSDGNLYCFLPLTESTGLPFHVNGHFAIDRGRRGLWEKGYREEWNNFVLSSVVTEALINALTFLQKYWLDNNMDILISKTCLNRCLTIYFSYFPRYDKAKDTYWKYFVKEFYRLVFEVKIPIFPEVKEKEKQPFNTHNLVPMREQQFFIEWIHLTTNIEMIDGGIVDTLYKLWTYRGNADDERLIKHILGKLSIRMCNINSDVVETMETSGQTSIIKTEPSVVMNLVKGRLTTVNCDIQMTVLENIDIAQSLLKYMLRCEHFDDNIEGLPLCITNDNYVHKFAQNTGVFCSSFCDILPCSRAKFVHIGLVPILARENLFKSNVLECFTFQNFLDILSNSYKPEIFCNDVDIRWLGNDSNHIDPFIIYRIFEFIYNESQRLGKSSDSAAIQSVFKQNVDKLSAWSFLPSKRKISGDFLHMLIPIKRAYSLLLDSFDNDIGPVLKRMSIPSLDNDVLTKYATIDKHAVAGAVRTLVSSTFKPHELLKCLHYHKLKLIKCQITADEAMKILRFFSQHISQIHAKLGNEAIELVKQLPLFETMQNGIFVSLDDAADVLVVTDSLPSPGIDEWARRQGKVIIQKNNNLQDLYNFLELPHHDRLHMYVRHILPSIKHMHTRYWLCHITFIKDTLLTSHLCLGLSNEQTQLIQLIQEIPFIEMNGTGYRASQLFDRTHPVFELMIEEGRFLPKEFACKSWINFLELIGLNVRPSGNIMIKFAQDLAQSGAMRTSERLIQVSNILVLCFLGEYGDTFEDHVFTAIKTIRFVVPYVVPRCMEQIFRGHCLTDCFISFSGSCSSHFANVCWTSLPLVHCAFDAKVMKLLGILQEPSTESVLTHCQNIFHEFKQDFDREDMVIDNKDEYVKHIYSFLLTRRDEINTTRLRDTPFVLIPDETIIKASSVFIFGKAGAELRPYLYQLPEQFLCYVDLFRTIGTTREPTCLQYANVLAIIKDQFADQELPHNVLEVVSKAVTKFFEILCMADDNGHKDIEKIKLLFLPNSKRIMTKSSELTIANNSVYKGALEGKCSLNMFIGFKELKIPLKNKTFSQLPLHLKPRFLTEDVSETISTDTMKELNNSSVALRCENCVHSNEFYEGLCRLLKRKDAELCTNEWNTDDDEILRDTLLNVRIKEVEGLKKVFYYKGIIVPGASITSGYHVQKLQIHSQNGAPVYHIYFQTMISYIPRNFLAWLHTGLMSLIRMCTKGRLSEHSVVLFQQVLSFEERPEGIRGFLDNHEIPALETAFDCILFPPVGTYVEEKFYPFMVQQMAPFKVHEYRYVALEIEIGDDEADLGDARYIYAHIMEPIHSDTPSLLRLKYKVFVGVERGGIIDVPIFRLYKFVPQNNSNTSDEVVLYDTEPIGSIPFDENCERIIDMLQEAFQLFEIHDRKRIIRRLLLKWHPDRNPGNEDYATRVFNFIQHCILRLEQNEELNIEQDAGAPNMSVSRYYNTFANANSTGHVYTSGFRENIDEYNISNRQGRYCHGASQRAALISPGEYRRWIKQAKLDFKTGQTQLKCKEQHPKTYNWICYHCHQACEKALKAAWFMKDANRCPRKEHRLSYIASGLDSVIATEARTFDGLFNEGKDYLKLRYPDCVQSDKIPSEVFTAEHAEFAVATAKKILEMVEELSR